MKDNKTTELFFYGAILCVLIVITIFIKTNKKDEKKSVATSQLTTQTEITSTVPIYDTESLDIIDPAASTEDDLYNDNRGGGVDPVE